MNFCRLELSDLRCGGCAEPHRPTGAPFLHRFSRFPLILFVLRLLSLTLGAFVPPGVNQLPNKQLLDQSRPGIFGVAAVSGDAVGLDHAAAPERVDLRREAHRSAER